MSKRLPWRVFVVAGAMTDKTKTRKENQNELLVGLFHKVCDIQRSRKTQGILDVYFVQYAGCVRG